MLLSTRNIAQFLVENRLLNRESLVNDNFVVVDVSRRNRNFKCLRKPAHGYFVKQVPHWDAQSVNFLRREATCYWLAKNDEAFSPLIGITPNYRHYDSGKNVLVVDLLGEAENLTQYHLRRQTFPVDSAALLGEVLGAYHRHDSMRLSANASMFPGVIPWILSIHETPAEQFNPLSPANAQMLAFLRRYPEFFKLLSEVRQLWKINGLIHGDMKWDNCMLHRENAELRLRVVDWELADFGDPCWDLGAIFQAYLTFWLSSMPEGAPLSAPELVNSAHYSLDTMQPAIGAFWMAYLKAAGINSPTAAEWLDKSLRYCAARMIQTAYEYMSASPQLTSGAVRLLQVSFNILTRTDDAARDLLGLS